MSLLTFSLVVVGILVVFGILFAAEYVWDMWVTWPFEQ